MNTITIPKSEYEELQTLAELYQTLLRRLPKKEWGIETYSPSRLREFLKEDRLDSGLSSQIRKALKS